MAQAYRKAIAFQSPRSGKFESNTRSTMSKESELARSFNPLDRGNLNQIA